MYTPEYSESFFLMKGDAPFGIIAFFVLIGFFGAIILGEKNGILAMSAFTAVVFGVYSWWIYSHRKRYDS